MTTRTRNLLLSACCLALVAFALWMPGLSDTTRTAVIAASFTFVTGLWMRSGRGMSAWIPLACLASLSLGACKQSVEWRWPYEGAVSAPQAGSGLNGNYLRMAEQAALPAQCAGFGCVYTKSTDHLIRFADTSGNERIMGEASRVRQVAGTPGDVAEGWIWEDTNTHYLYFRSNSGSILIGSSGGMVTLDTTQTVTGDKTFTGALVLPQTAAPAQTAEGSVSWDTDDDLLTVGTGAARKTMLDTNSTIGVSQLSGQVAVANGGTGAATTSQYFVFAGPSSGAGAPGFRLLVGGDIANLAGPTVVSGGATTAIGIATAYLTAPGQTGSATEIYLALATRSLTVRNLYCFAGTAPGGVATVVLTVRKNASDQITTCPITGAGTTCNDTTNTFTVAAGDQLSIKAVSSGLLAAGLTCSVEETQ